jgi:DNA polymerase-1
LERVSDPDVLTDPHRVDAFLASVSDAPFLALDTETSGLDPHQDKVLLIQFGTAQQQALVDATAIGPESIRAIFRPDRVVVMHNATFDLKMLWGHYGDEARLAMAQVADTQACEQLLRNGRRTDVVMQGFSLKALAERYAGMELDKTIRQGFYGIQSLSELSSAELHYARRDVEATWKVFAAQLPELERDGLLRVAGLEGAAAPAFAQLELTGFAVDAEAWKARLDEAQSLRLDTRKALDWEFREVADRDLFGSTTLNYDSDEEVLAALERLGVTVQSTRREALLATGHAAARAVATYREHQKIVSTYGEGFAAFIHPRTGRLHPRFKAIGAQTGRSSCSEPNLQNIPSNSGFRSCFRAPCGRRLVVADYAGAELRILAEMSKDPVYLRAFQDGQDLHAVVASRLFGVPVDQGHELRARAKAINFGLAYGMGVQGLAEQLGVSPSEAEELMEAHFRAFPAIRGFLEESARKALRRGYGETLAGRKLWFTDMRREGREEHTLTRLAKNMPIQGTNADMTKMAMARIVRRLAEDTCDARLVNMVHDELVLEAAEGDAERVATLVREEMISAGAELLRNTPVDVEVKLGTSWTK